MNLLVEEIMSVRYSGYQPSWERELPPSKLERRGKTNGKPVHNKGTLTLTERSRLRRKVAWVELTDAEFAARFEELKTIYHPAVAAVMAHEAMFGPGCMGRAR